MKWVIILFVSRLWQEYEQRSGESQDPNGRLIKEGFLEEAAAE